jgi:hypothetical protein
MSEDINIEHRLEEIEEKVSASHKILKGIQRRQALGFWFGIAKILVFVGLFYYVYQFSEPFIKQAKDIYIEFQGLSNSVESFKGVSIPDFLKNQQ